ncbi:60S acidic ribosomal protein P1 [Podila epicladia]|nr:60S acidic ribosomal protein P1 [Podila epicladia]
MSAELATSYAALILTDDNVEITSDKLQTLLKAANVEVESIWTSLFAKALQGKDVEAMLSNVGAAVLLGSLGTRLNHLPRSV